LSISEQLKPKSDIECTPTTFVDRGKKVRLPTLKLVLSYHLTYGALEICQVNMFPDLYLNNVICCLHSDTFNLPCPHQASLLLKHMYLTPAR
jgi:hypothetical protein